MYRVLTILLCIFYVNTSYGLIFNKEDPAYYFVDHETEILKIKEFLEKHKIVGITGMAGMGKSEMVRKYVSEYHDNYEIIAFLDAGVDLPPQLKALAHAINEKICNKSNCEISEDLRDVAQSLQKFLKDKSNWLLIFDNLHINENEKIKDFIEWYHNGHIIVCSQDANLLAPTILTTYLKSHDMNLLIKNIVATPDQELIDNLPKVLEGYPTYMLAHSVIYLHNNNHVTIEEYLKHMEKHDNKIRAHLKLILNKMNPLTKKLLEGIVVLNNQKISLQLLKQVYSDDTNLQEHINDIVRFGIMEQTNNDRNKPIFRMHDVIKKELLEIYGNEETSETINFVLEKLNKLMPKDSRSRMFSIVQDSALESNIEILLSNAEKYESNITLLTELRSNLLAHYLRIRNPYYAQKMAEWFNINRSKIVASLTSNNTKATYIEYLISMGIYKYFVVNGNPKDAEQYFVDAIKISDQIEGYESLKASLYTYMAQVYIFMGNIDKSEQSLEVVEKLKQNNPDLNIKSTVPEFVKSRIFLAKGDYNNALEVINLELLKETAELKKAKNNVKNQDTNNKENAVAEYAWLAPIYNLKAEVLNCLEKYEEAYEVSNNVYEALKHKKKNEFASFIISNTLIQLSRSELGLGKSNFALEHANLAKQHLTEDKWRNNQNIYNSHDIFLAPTFVAIGNALVENGEPEEGIKQYKIAKDIYEKGHERKNIGKLDSYSYLLFQGASAATKLSNHSDKEVWCLYFYQALVKNFGITHPRTQKAEGICRL